MKEFNRENFIRWIKEAVIGPAGEKYFDLETGEVLEEAGGGSREVYEIEDEVYLAFDDTDDGPLIFPEGIETTTEEYKDLEPLQAGILSLQNAIRFFSGVEGLEVIVDELEERLCRVKDIVSRWEKDAVVINEKKLVPSPKSSDYVMCYDSFGSPHLCIPFKEEYIEDIEYEVLLYFNCPATISLREWLGKS